MAIDSALEELLGEVDADKMLEIVLVLEPEVLLAACDSDAAHSLAEKRALYAESGKQVLQEVLEALEQDSDIQVEILAHYANLGTARLCIPAGLVRKLADHPAAASVSLS